MYELNMPVSTIRTKIRQEFERHRYVNQLPVVDVLIAQSNAEYQETLNFWKQISHVMKYFRAETDESARLPKSFMEGFLQPSVFFYGNHPIQYFCLAGVVLSRDDYEGRTVCVLDDCSGVTIEVACLKKRVIGSADAILERQQSRSGRQESDIRDDGRVSPQAAALAPLQHIGAVTSSPLHLSSLQPCTRVKVKGTISAMPIYQGPGQQPGSGDGSANSAGCARRFRLNLERYQLLPDLASEIRFWNERAQTLQQTLSCPWQLTAQEVEALRAKTQREAIEREERVIQQHAAQQALRRARATQTAPYSDREERARRRLERELRDQQRIMRRWQRDEAARRETDEALRHINAAFQRRLRGR
ncbi:hypothetical protein KEM52_005960 [Ascosphaera acerosa]|nr:hypothetical protein KEM52_005960 [Ascosphaera acerosa]